MRNISKLHPPTTVDPMGKAVYDFHFNEQLHPLLIFDKFGPPVPMDVAYYFRDFKKMPKLEQEALRQCSGKILDVGAGAGSHALYLQNNHLDITALDISKYNCEVMKDRGLKSVIHQSIWDYPVKGYDTLLFMMNGLGFVGTVENLQAMLLHFHKTTDHHVQLIVDSCDVYYLFENRPQPEDYYYGEIKCQYRYGELSSSWFKWLYIDEGYFHLVASNAGWNLDIIDRDTDRQFLARLTKR